MARSGLPREPPTDRAGRQQIYHSTESPNVEIIDAWAAANLDPDTGLTPSRPTAICRMIRSTARRGIPNDLGDHQQPASRSDINRAVARILERLDVSDPSTMPPATPKNVINPHPALRR